MELEWLEAYFTFITLHPVKKRVISILALIPETNKERVHFELWAVKVQGRKET